MGVWLSVRVSAWVGGLVWVTEGVVWGVTVMGGRGVSQFVGHTITVSWNKCE